MQQGTKDADATKNLDTAWRAYRDGIDALRETMHAMPIAQSAYDHASADRWLMQSQAAAHNLVMAPDPQNPHFLLHTVFEPNVYDWLLPNPDFLYRYAFVDGKGSYRIRGIRRSALFVDVQVLGGFWGDPKMRLLDSYPFDKWDIDSGDPVDLHLGPEPPGDGRPWVRTDPDAKRNTLIVREAFSDWGREQRSSLRIDALGRAPNARWRPDAGETIRRIDASLRMIRFCHETFCGQLTANVVAAVGYNHFLLLDTSRDEDAANPVAGYVPLVFDLEPGEAMVIEFDLPRATYWGLQVGDLWWQAADFVDHQSSLNPSQAVVDPDGRVRVVLAAEDPGVANWLATDGLLRGVVLLRWYHADRHPIPEAKRMAAEAVKEALPAETTYIKSDERRAVLAARREAIHSRYFDGVEKAGGAS